MKKTPLALKVVSAFPVLVLLVAAGCSQRPELTAARQPRARTASDMDTFLATF